MMFHLSVLQKTVGGFGCVIFGHKSFTMAFSIPWCPHLINGVHLRYQWLRSDLFVQLLKKQRSRDKPLGAKPPVNPAAQSLNLKHWESNLHVRGSNQI